LTLAVNSAIVCNTQLNGERVSQAYIDHGQARQVLAAAILAAKSANFSPRHPKANFIAEVMLGRHLTYRYVLFTNLLAKATNGAANGLVLQAGADLPGAFDSRSLCHKVVVDFDRDAHQLAGKLGRSNEPYLNKPARYTTLSAENAVRRGYDRNILERCIDVLGGLAGQADARAALLDAIYYTMQRDALVAEVAESTGDASLHSSLWNFAREVTSVSNEGESCAIVTGLAFYLIGRANHQAFDIRVHPVNQAGASSREVLDVDVYQSGVLIHTAEVKDKIFTLNDVDHAAAKVAASGLGGFYFICGPRSGGAAAGGAFISAIANKGIRVSFVDVEQFFSTCIGLTPNDLNVDEVWRFIDASMSAARVKDVTRSHIFLCAQRAELIMS
jgi:hypothetical protein